MRRRNKEGSAMHKCRRHPDRDAVLACQKYGYGYCQECADEGVDCSDPELYCKFRQQCIIWEFYRERMMEEKRRAAAG